MFLDYAKLSIRRNNKLEIISHTKNGYQEGKDFQGQCQNQVIVYKTTNN